MYSSNAYVYKFGITLTSLTKKLYEERPEMYNAVVFDERVEQLNKGFILHRMNKPTTHGTKLTFKAAEKEDEITAEVAKLEEERVQVESDLKAAAEKEKVNGEIH